MAESADVSVSTLYQFFDNKDDLMHALAERHVTQMQGFRDELFGRDVIYVPPDILIGRTVDWLVEYSAAHPTFNQIFSGSWSDPMLLETLNGVTGAIVGDLAAILVHHGADGEKAQLSAAVLVYVIKGMLGLLESAESTTHNALLAEIKRMSLLYFEDTTQ